MNDLLVYIELEPRLSSFVKACESYCVAECCGLDAFCFSPLVIAAHLSYYSGSIQEESLIEIEKDLVALELQTKDLQQNEHGFICGIEILNQLFTRESMDKLIRQLRTNLRLAPKVLDYSNKLEEETS
ncbi:MAG: hypothetical protein COA78_15545 [Blastopirellula sp.]|nr:MAG: hypothetical protein COA78_15545 [Blastopirellula sp.]